MKNFGKTRRKLKQKKEKKIKSKKKNDVRIFKNENFAISTENPEFFIYINQN